MATSNLTSQVLFSLYVLFAVQELGVNAAEVGIIYGVGVAGGIIGAALAPRIAARFGVGRTIVAGALLGSFEVWPVALASSDLAVPLLVCSGLVGHFGWTIYAVNETSLRQAITPSNLLGRVNATTMFLADGAVPLGALAGGILGEVLGLRHALILSAIGSSLSFLWVLGSAVRKVENIPAQ